jgi:hypothetical protein
VFGGNREQVQQLSDLDYWKSKGNAGTSNGQPQTIEPTQRADLFCVTGSALVANTRADNSFTFTANSGQPVSLDGRVFSSFVAPSSDWIYAIVPRDALPTFPSIAPGGGGTGGFSINGNLAFTLPGSNATITGPPTNQDIQFLASDTTGLMSVRRNVIDFEIGGLTRLAGYFIYYNGIETAGIGVPAIYANGGPQHQTNAAPASVTYSPPSTAGQYRLFVTLLVKTATTLTLKMSVTYTGADGTSHVDALVFQKEGSATLLTSVTAADRYVADQSFLIDASGGTITIADASGTYTTCEYWVQPNLEQLA